MMIGGRVRANREYIENLSKGLEERRAAARPRDGRDLFASDSSDSSSSSGENTPNKDGCKTPASDD